ncbi:carboxypeptidase regulatory-like domain-containing protein [Deinococcus cellulosilyticus]|uniref:HYR domain-containing protein n=1 Tax=Deinococcus cellulosilyticus (strain DSM 18568 / NBRC 106333 / KACC 11606 / 5516J-15) TaxID=1223518 RepID=A0A511N5W1_DEIC1|nr:carboxypeptidase regulatory-like domain-containing protein [Deinococcus cellulosilyticus]GEM48252.1 hypothetical protein DC3_38870 [Deinococcus cellulosilyticus NBRC 106333 = KACC 11606]
MNGKLFGLSLTAVLLLASCGTVSVPKDTTPPEIKVVTENNQTLGTDSVTLQGTIKDNGSIKSASYSLNGGAVQVITLGTGGAFTVKVTGLKSGVNTVLLKVVDGSNNEKTFEFKVNYNPSLNDKTPPTITFSTPNNQTTTKTKLLLEGTITDDVKFKAATISLNAGPAQPLNVAANGTFSTEVTGLQVGSNTVLILATDEAGNKKESTFKINYDANGTGTVKVEGNVVSSNAGAAVSDSHITVDGLPDIAIETDSNGQFSLDLNPGVYNLNFSREGHAASRIEGVIVTESGTAVPLKVIQKIAIHALVAKPPVVTAVQTPVGDSMVDVTPGTVIPTDRPFALQVKVKAADESLSATSAYVTIGNHNSDMDPGLRFFNDPKNTELDTGIFALGGPIFNGAQGLTVLNVVAYDFNGNRIQKLIPVNVVSAPSTTPLGEGPTASALAYTVSTDLNLSTPVGPMAAPAANTNLFVQVRWNYNNLSGEPLGFRIWKSYDNKVFRPLTQVAGNQRTIWDSDPTLEAGKTTYYQVEAYNSTTNSYGKTTSTTPLDAFNVVSLGPDNHSTNVSVNPTLTWTVDKLVGDVRYFYPAIWDYPSQNSTCYWGMAFCKGSPDYMYSDDGKTPGLKRAGNIYSLPFNENGKAVAPKLQSYHSYTFALSAAAFNKDFTAISVAQDWSFIFLPFGQCNFGGPVCDGKLSTFSTGDGSN